jgi:hypothetical protein
MPPIQAGTDPNIPYPRHTFWFWELINILVPLIGIVFLDWHIFTLVILFWWEIFCWGCVGVLKILTANAAETVFSWIFARFFYGLGFSILYGGLFLILFSFTFTEFSSDSMLNTDKGLRASMLVIAINFFVEYVRSELISGRFRTRFPVEVIFERMVYALPLAALVLFVVVPLSQRFEGDDAAMIIGIGIVLSKFLMDVALHYAPGLLLRINEMEEEEEEQQQTNIN